MAIHHGGDIYDIRFKNKELLDFSININPLGIPENVKQAARKSIECAWRYPDTECRELCTALSAYEHVPREHIIFGNGAAELIYAFSQAIRPTSVFLPAPTFSEYEESLQTIPCGIQYLVLDKNDSFSIRKEALIDSISESTDLLFLCNPNNPAGTLMERNDLIDVLDFCKKSRIRVLVDECFLDFTDDPASYTLTGLVEAYPNLFLLKAFTKKYAMAGFRLGYGLCSDTVLLSAMHQFIQPWNISVISQSAGTAALLEEDYISKARSIIKQERMRMTSSLRSLGYTTYDSTANYILFEGPHDLWEKAADAGFLLRCCGNYIGLEQGYYRTAVKLPDENGRFLSWLAQL